MEADSVTVKNLVKEYLAAQTLRIMPRAPFTEAVVDYVEKDDKHAIQQFIETSLKDQFTEMVRITRPDEQEDGEEEIVDVLNEKMESFRQQREKEHSEGKLKRRTTTKKLKPKPDGWDTEDDGRWEDFPGALDFEEDPNADKDNDDDNDEPAPTKKRAREALVEEDEDDDAALVASGRKAPAKKAPAKRAPAKPRAAPKAAPKPRATTTTTRGKKAAPAQPFEISDDEDDDDVVMIDKPVEKKVQPKRAAATRGGRAGAAAGRQTLLNFSQSQAKTQTAHELSDDEIDDDDDDAFEPMQASGNSRRR